MNEGSSNCKPEDSSTVPSTEKTLFRTTLGVLGEVIMGQSSSSEAKVADLQHENDALKDEVNRAKDQFKSLTTTYKGLQQDNAYIHHEYQQLVNRSNNLLGEHEHLKGNFPSVASERDETQRRFHEGRKMLQGAEAEKHELQEQVTQFKKIISTSSQKEHQVTDDAIRQNGNQLFYKFQGFVVKRFRGVTFDFALLPDSAKTSLLEHAPNAHSLGKPFWLDLVTSIISRVMTEYFAPGNFFGISERNPIAAAMVLARSVDVSGGPEGRAWLITTRKLLKTNAKDALDRADRQLGQILATEIHSILQQAMPTKWTQDVQDELANIFQETHGFYRLLYSQDASYDVTMRLATVREEQQLFDPNVMETTNMEEDEIIDSGRAVEVTVFPAVFKSQTTNNVKSTVVVAKAKARLQPNLIKL